MGDEGDLGIFGVGYIGTITHLGLIEWWSNWAWEEREIVFRQEIPEHGTTMRSWRFSAIGQHDESVSPFRP